MSKTPRILLTGFTPFGDEDINPSWEAVRVLHGEHVAGHEVVAQLLPTAFDASRSELEQALASVEPALMIGVGQAGGRSRLSIERVAINVQDARLPDNAGAQPIDEPVIADGPAAYFSTLPIKAMLAALQADGLPAEISNTAGTYVCNHVAYLMLHLAARRKGVRAGFIHIPYLLAQAARFPQAPSMAQADVTRGLMLAMRVAASQVIDRKLGAGTLD
ncbi:pyroglutamyl-peptidase I [Dyella soli]|uniref:Pyrrolidone-carboxylate peptidase n=1 Tax=Dyella soli TaxID=522319 RepID=A0A4R0YQD9_9GAMM|nr:pyroglutamyl-peptidase I [Dyella soli]TCI08800.1 pyroglutamyl-peptidase I [Dyella soli]